MERYNTPVLSLIKQHIGYRCAYDFSSERGAGLITAIMVVAVGTLVLFGIQKKTSNVYKMTTYDEQLQALEGIKRTIRDNLHSWSNLGDPNVKKTPPPKYSCSAYSSAMDIKNSSGDKLDFSPFEIKAACEGNFLKVKITNGPKIGGRKVQDWSQTKIAKDLFLGTEELCRAYFDPAYPYTWKVGGNYMINNLWDEASVKDVDIKTWSQETVTARRDTQKIARMNSIMEAAARARGSLLTMVIRVTKFQIAPSFNTYALHGTDTEPIYTNMCLIDLKAFLSNEVVISFSI